MNKSDVVAAVSDKTLLSRAQAEQAVSALLETVVSEVRAGNKVTMVGFGSFNPTARAARKGRNPRTGEPVRVAAKKGVRFAASTTFKTELNAKGRPRRAVASASAGKQGNASPAAAGAQRSAPAVAGPHRTSGAPGRSSRGGSTEPQAAKAPTRRGGSVAQPTAAAGTGRSPARAGKAEGGRVAAGKAPTGRSAAAKPSATDKPARGSALSRAKASRSARS